MDTRKALIGAFVGLGVMAGVLTAQPYIPEKVPEPKRVERPEKVARSAKVIAVKLHGDWCEACKKMGTLFEDLGKKFDGEPVLFSRLDLSDQRGRVQGEYLVAAMGLSKVWGELGGGEKTGEIVLIDAATKKVVDRIGADAGWEKAREAVEKAMGK
jgi:thiol-disulfide isomerase/thioredoxin